METASSAVTVRSKHKPGTLLKVLGLVFGVAVIVGNSIGAGILRTPPTVARELPIAWMFMLAWMVGGLYAMLGANSVAELGAAIPRAGGQYAFSSRALGRYWGFLVGFSDWISTCTSTTAMALVLAEYLPTFFPSLANYRVGTASVAIILFTLINWRGVVWGGRTQEITSLIKTVAFFALIAACFILGGGATPTQAPPPAAIPVGLSLVTAFVLALQGIIYTYDGWTGVLYFSEEVKNPGRDIPRSMFGGVLLVMAIYILLNLATVYVLPMGAIASSELPAGLAATAIFGSRGDTLIRLLGILTFVSAINACIMMASRTMFGMSRDGLIYRGMVRVNQGGTPSIALWIGAAVSIAFCFFKEYERVAAVTAFFFVVSYACSFASVFVLRRKEPNLKRPYRAWGHPWTTGAALVGSIVFLAGAVWSDQSNTPWAVAALAVSYPLYRLVRTRDRSKPLSSRSRGRKGRKRKR